MADGELKVGVYIDGFNLYYGARSICGRGKEGWRWLDIRFLSTRILERQWAHKTPTIDRIVYCSAKVKNRTPNDRTAEDQELYLRALRYSNSADKLELGNYVSNVKQAPLAVDRGDRKNPKPEIIPVDGPHPLLVHSPNLKSHTDRRAALEGSIYLVSYLHTEEKGSDVNLATHLVVDVLSESVDAAVIISNDSDLALPVQLMREKVPIGVVNPGNARLAGKLRGQADDGPGGHWWYQLKKDDYIYSQFPERVKGVGGEVVTKPQGW